jgi:monofunctional chorismate mutase
MKIRTVSKEEVRGELARKESGIILTLFERSRLPLNASVYRDGSGGVSLFQSYIRGREDLDRMFGRYKDPRERSLFPKSMDNQAVVIRKVDYGEAVEGVNKKKAILEMYLLRILPQICQPGDDAKEEGSCIEKDKDCLDRISARVHYGDFVALAKLHEKPALFVPMIRAGAWGDIRLALKDEKQEASVVERVSKKCLLLELDQTLGTIISGIWNRDIMPITLDDEVDFFKLHRKEIVDQFGGMTG